jgi:protein-S-isoprenylcysteine O-methyltransferase Ste14
MFFTMLGAMLPASGFCTFGRAKTTIDPVRPDSASTLVRSGVYRYTRNPRYVGFTLLLTGFAVFLASPWAAPGPFMFAAFTTRFQILPEERALRSKFGADYERCLEATRRWF